MNKNLADTLDIDQDNFSNLFLTKQFNNINWFINKVSFKFPFISWFFFPFYIGKINRLKRLYVKLKNEYNIRTEKFTRTNNELEELYQSTRKRAEDIKASIEYAKTIQSTILPLEEALNRYLKTFVIYQPKDIVSGDFYWISKNLNQDPHLYKVLFILGDCTGHGVPGAFMTLIGERIINEIVHLKNVFLPSEVLHSMDIGVQKTLKQHKTFNNDGMDAGVCLIEKLSSNQIRVVFAGAKQNLIFYRKEENKVQFIKGSRYSIGGIHQNLKSEINIPNHEILLKEGDRLFLYTDGFTDQFNKSGKRFGRLRFIDIINENSTLELLKQKKMIEFMWKLHKQFEKQMDDVSVVGIEL